MQPCIEVVLMPLVDTADCHDPTNFAYRASMLNNSMTSAQPGYRKGAWGVYGANPQVLVTLTAWDDVSCHQRFMQQPEHEDLIQALVPLCASDLQVFHINTEAPVKSGPADLYVHYIATDASETKPERSDINTSWAGWSIEDTLVYPSSGGEARPRKGKGPEKAWVEVSYYDGSGVTATPASGAADQRGDDGVAAFVELLPY